MDFHTWCMYSTLLQLQANVRTHGRADSEQAKELRYFSPLVKLA